ncbi:MAG: hypothetical protein CSA75_03605 [Sorangium cellulosum]|nr:MAG: hypothetical protein CSA75_03605 [Sorangium cellulosum]
MEAWRLFLMEGTQPNMVSTATREFHRFADNGDDVCSFTDACYRLFRNHRGKIRLVVVTVTLALRSDWRQNNAQTSTLKGPGRA